MPATVRALVLSLLLLSLSAAVPAAQAPASDEFQDEITVSLRTVTVRVVDDFGRPILGLTPRDFRVRLRGREVSVAGVDWIASGEAVPASQAVEGAAGRVTVEEPRAPGKLVVFFVQADLNPSRISGQLRLRPYVRELLATLRPEDRAAVVSYDSHLRFRQDFTGDWDAVHLAIDHGMLWGGEEADAEAEPVSLLRHFDADGALRAASPEQALRVTAAALEKVPGEKVMVFLGWGLGTFSSFGVQMTPDFAPAVRALKRAHVSVFVLDVTSADSHSLEAGLQNVAEATGGTYAKTFILPGLATRALARTISGYYLLTVNPEDLPPGGGVLQIRLRNRRGNVVARPVTVR
jgi:VWFA-related protein